MKTMVVTKIPKTCKKTQEKYLKIGGKIFFYAGTTTLQGLLPEGAAVSFRPKVKERFRSVPTGTPAVPTRRYLPARSLCPGSRFGSENKEQLCPCSVTAMPRPPAPFPTSLPITSPTPPFLQLSGFPSPPRFSNSSLSAVHLIP